MKTKRQQEYREALAHARDGWRPQDYSARLLIPDQRIAIASDVHLPYYDETLMARFLDECADQRVQAIVWLGDLLDHHTWSSYGVTDHTTRYTRELSMLRELITLASSVVEAQYWSSGNHEDRLFRKTDHQIGMEQLAGMAGLTEMLDDGRLIISDNPTLDAFPDRTGKPTWMLTHPKQYSPQPLVTPSKLAQRFGVNVLSAHAHHWAMGVDASGQHICIETGGLFEPKYHRYSQYGVTSHRAWTKGYWLLIEGKPLGTLGEIA